MSEGYDELKNRLDGMLRRWGAEEASRTVKVAPAPAKLHGRGPQAADRWRRWWPMAAAAAFLLAAAGLWIFRPAGSADGKDALTAKTERKVLEMDLGKLRQEHKTALEDIKKLQAAEQALRQQAGLAAQSNKVVTEQLQQAQQQAAEAKKKIEDVSGRLAAATTQAAQFGREKAELEAKLVAAAERAQGADERAQAAEKKLNEETQRLETSYAEILAQKRKSDDEVAVMRLQREAMMEYFQQAYMALVAEAGSSSAPGAANLGPPASADAAGLRARQEVARRSRLIQRIPQLRGEVRDQATRDLLDRLEVMLTRLEMLNVRDGQAVQAFVSLVQENAMHGQIDQALMGGNEGMAVRTWLFEAMLVLTGVANVG